ncbi:MAG TPA: DUF3592 domain-containing protein [Actinomycetales bacterium]|nr:DUF3592 domain-containing protein [Actinomycetales bacterium]
MSVRQHRWDGDPPERPGPPGRGRHRAAPGTPRAPKKPEDRTDALVTAAISTVIALVFLAFAASDACDTRALADRGEVTTATITDTSPVRYGTRIHITYTTPGGRVVRSDTTKYYDPEDGPELGRGDTVQVRYDPRKPTRVQGADWEVGDYWNAGILAVLGGGFLLFGAAPALFRARRGIRRRSRDHWWP